MTDVLVIGGGVAGLCCAHFLRARGRSVTVVERGPIGGPESASSGNTGFVAYGGVPLGSPGALRRGWRSTLRPDGHLALPFAPDRAQREWLRHLRRAADTSASLAALKSLSLRLIEDLGPVTRAGLVVVYRSPAGFEAAVRAVPAAVARGVPVRVLDPGDLAVREPGVEFDVAGALYQENAAFVRAPEFLFALAADLTARGVTILPDTPVTGFETAGGRVTTVHTAGGPLHPAETVIAAGTWSPALARLLDLKIQIQPVKGYAVTMPTPAGAPRAPVLLHEGTVAVRPLGSSLRLAGSLALSGSPAVSRRRVGALLATVRAHLPALSLPDSPAVWTGYRPCTPDSLPLLGRPAAWSNVTLACGHGHIGMGLAPATGLLVAEALTGEPPSLDMTPFAVDRFGSRS
jgi:D-amino-acid dehydrogenase